MNVKMKKRIIQIIFIILLFSTYSVNAQDERVFCKEITASSWDDLEFLNDWIYNDDKAYSESTEPEHIICEMTKKENIDKIELFKSSWGSYWNSEYIPWNITIYWADKDDHSKYQVLAVYTNITKSNDVSMYLISTSTSEYKFFKVEMSNCYDIWWIDSCALGEVGFWINDEVKHLMSKENYLILLYYEIAVLFILSLLLFLKKLWKN